MRVYIVDTQKKITPTNYYSHTRKKERKKERSGSLLKPERPDVDEEHAI